jgi:hypothetical protein
MKPKNDHLKDAQIQLQSGLLVTREWLLAQGLSTHNIDNQLKSGRLVAMYRGVYHRPHVSLNWQNIASSLSFLYHDQWLVGGLTALELLGFAHFMNLSGQHKVHLYGAKPLPKWVQAHLTEAEKDVSELTKTTFYWQGTSRLWHDNNDELLKRHTTNIAWRGSLPPMLVSTAERALLEMLMIVPKQVSLENADYIVQAMTNLSPRKLKEVLTACKSVKVKRLFFWLADRQQYSWRKKLQIENFDLGAGKRVIVKGGKLDQQYNITVPEHLHG